MEDSRKHAAGVRPLNKRTRLGFRLYPIYPMHVYSGVSSRPHSGHMKIRELTVFWLATERAAGLPGLSHLPLGPLGK